VYEGDVTLVSKYLLPASLSSRLVKHVLQQMKYTAVWINRLV